MAICAREGCKKKFVKVVPWKKYCCRECFLLVWAGKKMEEKKNGK